MTLTLTVCVPQGVLKVSVKLPRVLFNDVTVNVLPVPVTPRLFGPPSATVTGPFGFTVKLIVPLPCFENVSGLGLVVTVTVQGVGVTTGDAPGLAPGLADGDAPGDAPGLAPGLAAGLAPGDGDGLELGEGLESGVGSTIGVGDGSTCGGVGSLEGDGAGEGSGLLLPFRLEPESMPVSPFTFTLTFGTSSR